MIYRLARRAGAILGMTAATWLALSLVLYLLLYRTLTDVYLNVARSVLQVECGRMVEGPLLYTLAPGECRFVNPEFDTRVSVDRDGFRNKPEHLGQGPIKAAVIGDSHAMGWGVAQGEKLSAQLARDPRLTVRDLSMSSYGTARELMALMTHAPDANVVVLQYCNNDRAENAEFLRDPAAFKANAGTRATAYAAEIGHLQAASARNSTARALLRHAMTGLAATWRLMLLPPRGPSEPPPASIAEEARLFAGVLAHFNTALAGKTLIVFESFPRSSRVGFAPAFRSALERAGLSQVQVMDIASVIGPRDFYHLDDHMRARGHAKVAARILAELR